MSNIVRLLRLYVLELHLFLLFKRKRETNFFKLFYEKITFGPKVWVENHWLN